jgi:nucleotide-binding universal stress UspA family protein
MKRILIATDGSEAARQALELGVDLARHEEAAVAIVQVIPSSDVVPMDGFGLVGRVPYVATAADEAVLGDAVALAEREGVPAISKLLHGDPATEIVEYAAVLGADLIVVGSRGHGALASALLGSVSRGVLARAQRAVLVVRATQVTEPAPA